MPVQLRQAVFMDTMTTDSEQNLPNLTMTEDNEIIWAISARGNYVHAYPGIKALESGTPLCGNKCAPVTMLEHFDLSNEIIQKAACPRCLARLTFARYMKPLSELYSDRKAAERKARDHAGNLDTEINKTFN